MVYALHTYSFVCLHAQRDSGWDLSNIPSMRRSALSPDQTPRRELKIQSAVESFLTKFEVFNHCVECLMLLLKQNDFRQRN